MPSIGPLQTLSNSRAFFLYLHAGPLTPGTTPLLQAMACSLGRRHPHRSSVSKMAIATGHTATYASCQPPSAERPQAHFLFQSSELLALWPHLYRNWIRLDSQQPRSHTTDQVTALHAGHFGVTEANTPPDAEDAQPGPASPFRLQEPGQPQPAPSAPFRPSIVSQPTVHSLPKPRSLQDLYFPPEPSQLHQPPLHAIEARRQSSLPLGPPPARDPAAHNDIQAVDAPGQIELLQHSIPSRERQASGQEGSGPPGQASSSSPEAPAPFLATGMQRGQSSRPESLAQVLARQRGGSHVQDATAFGSFQHQEP